MGPPQYKLEDRVLEAVAAIACVALVDDAAFYTQDSPVYPWPDHIDTSALTPDTL